MSKFFGGVRAWFARALANVRAAYVSPPPYDTLTTIPPDPREAIVAARIRRVSAQADLLADELRLLRREYGNENNP